MTGSLLVASQISSLFPPSHATTITLQSNRTNPYLPTNADSDLPPEHAIHSSVLYTPETGTVALRVLHAGLTLELIPLSVDVTPIRFVFPSPIIPSPGLFLWEGTELHVVAVTVSGSIFRLVIPIVSSHQLWVNPAQNIWPREYLIKNHTSKLEGHVHVVGPDCVVVGLPNASLLRLDANSFGDESTDDEWSETVLQPHGSLLSTLTSFLSHSSAAAEVVSITSHTWPTDSGDVYTFSRDRVVRHWKPRLGCVATKSLTQSPGRDASPSPGSTPAPPMLLEREYRNLIRIFTLKSEESFNILVFLPALAATINGGTFVVLDPRLSEVTSISCSSDSSHCHLQDFVVVDSTLYVLWDQQGQAMMESISIDLDRSPGLPDLHSQWQSINYAPEPELTPAYLEEILLTQGSLHDRFYDVVMRPGMFSSYTLRTAIDRYTDACLSIPGSAPPQLMTSYSSIGENIAAVVGCTVRLQRDPRTGAMQYENYWNALKRDWEGFIARCREIERGARWPLALGVREHGEVIVIERERVGGVVSQDPAITLCKELARKSTSIDDQYELLTLMWGLRSKLGLRVLRTLEDQIMELMHQEIAFSLGDIVKDQAFRCNFRAEVDVEDLEWIDGRLDAVGSLEDAVNAVLNTLGGFEVKREEDEVELMLPPPHSEWSKAQTASYLITSINARYDLCLCMVTLFYFVPEAIWQEHSSLLAEVFAVFRGAAMLRLAARQPASLSNKPPVAETPAADDVVSLMKNMQVTKSIHASPNVSLTHRLLSHFGDGNYVLPSAAHRFIDNTGLLRSISPARATTYEVSYCEKLRVLGNYDIARETLSWLPRTPGVSYVHARLWLNIGRHEDAAQLLEKLGGAFGLNSAIAPDDKSALLSVLPNREYFDSPTAFYLHVAVLYKLHGLVHYEIHFTHLAITLATPEVDTTSMWQAIIRGNIELGHYDDAYTAWAAAPHEALKKDSLTQLVYRMCEDGAIHQLTTFNFANFADEVESIIAFKARNTDPRLQPNHSRILYSWYTIRGDYRSAALSMYQRARKLHQLISNTSSLVSSLAHEELTAYLTAMNALSLVDPKNAWILTSVTTDIDGLTNGQPQSSRYIPESKFSAGKHNTTVVHLEDIEYNYTLLSAQLDLIRDDPALLTSSDFLLPPTAVVLRLALANRFDQAIAVARTLKVDMSNLFAHLTTQCLRLSRDPDTVLQESAYDWLLNDTLSTWGGSPADKGWRYLRQCLERHDGPETDCAYTKVAYETMLASQRSSPPPWILRSLEEHHHEFLIRINLRYENLGQAIEHTLSFIRKADTRLARDPPKNAASTWLPYTLIDQLLVATAAHETTLPQLAELRLEVANRTKRMQDLSRFSS